MATENLIQSGDVLLFSSTNPNFIERLILWGESGTVFHAAIYIGGFNIVEATCVGVKISPLTDYIGFDVTVRRLHSPNPSNQDDNLDIGTKIMSAALALVGDRYSYIDDVVDGVRFLFKKCGLNSISSTIANKYQGFNGLLNCSALCAQAIQNATGINVCAPKEIQSITPQDLLVSTAFKTIENKVI